MVRRTSTAGETRKLLLKAGEHAFSEKGYHAASVSEICRRAGLANGTFYRHFENKEEIFAALVECLQDGMCERIERVLASRASGREKLLRAYRDVLAFVARETALYRVGRSAEAMRLGIHRRFRSNLAQALAKLLRAGVESGDFRAVDAETAAYALLGIIEFTVMRYILWEPGSVDEDVRRTFEMLVFHGYDSGSPPRPSERIPPHRAPLHSAGEPFALHGGEATRQALLNAAERLFGQAGFHQTSVSAIAYVAGVAQGTFYLYFPSKVAAFVELAREINQKFRDEEREALTGIADRREVERVGFETFFRFIDAHRGAYGIIREAELIDPETGRWYYERLARSYMVGLRAGIEHGEIRPIPSEPLAYALLGAGHSVALWWPPDGEESPSMERTVRELLDFLERGLLNPS